MRVSARGLLPAGGPLLMGYRSIPFEPAAATRLRPQSMVILYRREDR